MEKFLAGYNCAQAVLYAYCEQLGFDKDKALKLACGFGAGMARTKEVCGAISGAIMVLGLRYGRGEGQDRTPTEETYRKVQELMSQFEITYGSCLCRNLLEGCDLNTPAGRQHFIENDFINQKCKTYVVTVMESLEKLL